MKVERLEIDGAFGIRKETVLDDRGSLVRLWDEKVFPVSFEAVQLTLVNNPRLGTLRGLHFQVEPNAEHKLIHCISGKVFDVIVDLRKSSATRGKCLGLNLGPLEKFFGVYVPSGCAHGYLTLEKNSSLIYAMDKPYNRFSATGIRWNDPSLNIKWPFEPMLLSKSDDAWPNYVW